MGNPSRIIRRIFWNSFLTHTVEYLNRRWCLVATCLFIVPCLDGVSGSRSYGGTGSRFFWKADVEDIGRAYSLHTRRSAKVFDDFYNRRLAYVKSVLEVRKLPQFSLTMLLNKTQYSRECQQWGEAFAIQRFQAEADAQQERLNS